MGCRWGEGSEEADYKVWLIASCVGTYSAAWGVSWPNASPKGGFEWTSPYSPALTVVAVLNSGPVSKKRL
eukprot:6696015-Pyramimonas_sp.AAC.2